jgi:RHS repeat-associated protein
LTYDNENRLTSITVGANTTTYVYDGDGNRVKKTVNGVSTYYVGNHYEVTNGNALKYYYFGKQRVAMRVGTNPVTYLHTDHLGSTSATSGASVSSQNYYAFGNIRSTTGTVPTDFGFTGQRRDSYIKLIQMGARWYDPDLGRFTQPDSIVPQPGNPQTLNRYSYVSNNPIKYVDPSGHTQEDYYVFVQGCIRTPQGPSPCGNDPKVDWHDYLSLLRQQFSFDEKEFADWVDTHVTFVHAWSADPSPIAQAVNGINPGNGSIFLIGHSAGGAALLNYLQSIGPSSTSSHIGGAVILDAPTANPEQGRFSWLVGAFIGFERYRDVPAAPMVCNGSFNCTDEQLHDRFSTLGERANAAGIHLLQVSYGGDAINPLSPTGDVPFKVYPYDPGYAPLGDIGKNHGYFFQNPNAIHDLWNYIFEQGIWQ